MLVRILPLAVAVAALSLAAPACDAGGRTGETICGVDSVQKTCFHNSYCSNFSMGECSVGCSTDENCQEGYKCDYNTLLGQPDLQGGKFCQSEALAATQKQFKCDRACEGAATKECDARGTALTSAEKDTCTTKCAALSDAKVDEISSCWLNISNSRFCVIENARLCFSEVL